MISGRVRVPSPSQVTQILTKAAAGLKAGRQAEIAFFGGSFTALPKPVMIGLLQAAAPFVGHDGITGIRLSTRPDAIDPSILQCLKEYGVTAVELGAQSMDDNVLLQNERGHTAAQVVEASRLIQQFGFSLGLQMMTGLYGSSPGQDEETARQLLQLRPDTVRIYPTVTFRGTRLARLYEAGEYVPPSLKETVALCSRLLKMFETTGIPVIKLGLHAGSEQNAIAGPYHPALRELCESEVYLQTVKELLPAGVSRAVIKVHPSCVSKMIGQKRINLKQLAKQGVSCTVQGAEAVAPHSILLQPLLQAEEQTGKEKSYVPEIAGSTGLQVVSG